MQASSLYQGVVSISEGGKETLIQGDRLWVAESIAQGRTCGPGGSARLRVQNPVGADNVRHPLQLGENLEDPIKKVRQFLSACPLKKSSSIASPGSSRLRWYAAPGVVFITWVVGSLLGLPIRQRELFLVGSAIAGHSWILYLRLEALRKDPSAGV